MGAVADDCDVIGHSAGSFCKYCLAPDPNGNGVINDAIKHNWTRVDGAPYQAATCDVPGFQTVYCSNCKQTVTQTLPALHHEFGNVPTISVKPTCDKWGYDLFGCIHCGTKFENISYAPLGHKFDKEIGKVEATCTTPGGTKFECSNGCGETKIIADPAKPALGHGTLVDIVAVAPTCDTKGNTAGKRCTVCNAIVEGGVELPALGCAKVTYVCTVKNVKDVVCSRCGKIYEEGVAATLEASVESHVYVRTAASEDPDCVTAGTDVLVCKYCGKSAMKSVPALGHDIETTVVDATCMQPGYKLVSCKREGCGAQISHEVLPINPNGHIGEITKKVEPTCITAGYEFGTCVYCGLPYEKVLPKLDHDIVYIEAKPATCDKDGNTAGSYCKREGCGTVFVESIKIPMLGHKIEVIKGYPATCYEKGLTDGEKCTVCNKIVKEQTVILPYDHKDENGDQYADVKTKVASCVGKGNIGYTAHECSHVYCDAAYIDNYYDIPAHTWGAWQTKLVNCVEDGYEYRECQVNGCDAIEINEKTRIKAEGHKDKDGNVIPTSCTRPEGIDLKCVNKFCPCDDTCDKDGNVKVVHEYEFLAHIKATCVVYEHDIFVCKVCGDKKVFNVVDKYLDHSWKVDSTKPETPTFEKASEQKSHCTVCNATKTEYLTKGVQFKASVANGSNPKEAYVNGTKKVVITYAIRGDKEEFNSFNAFVTYNKDQLEFVSAETVKEIGGKTATVLAHKVEDGKINVIASISNDADGKVIDTMLTGEYETFLTVTFKIKSGVHSDTASDVTKDLTVTFGRNQIVNPNDPSSNKSPLIDKDGNFVTMNFAEAKTVIITVEKLADVNNDGYINVIDGVSILKLMENEKYDATADLNGDGKVNASDFGNLQKVIIGMLKYDAVANARK